MATQPSGKLRVMVDANVLGAVHGWPRFPYEVLKHAVKGDFSLILSSYVVEEARRNITRLFPDVLPRFEAFLIASEPEMVANPATEEVATHKDLVRNLKD